MEKRTARSAAATETKSLMPQVQGVKEGDLRSRRTMSMGKGQPMTKATGATKTVVTRNRPAVLHDAMGARSQPLRVRRRVAQKAIAPVAAAVGRFARLWSLPKPVSPWG
jgi:hypothetical protein